MKRASLSSDTSVDQYAFNWISHLRWWRKGTENILGEIMPEKNFKFDEKYKLTDPKHSRYPKHKQYGKQKQI